jgi:hypothetical protein
MKRLISYQLSLVATETNIQDKVKQSWEELGDCVGTFRTLKRLGSDDPEFRVLLDWSVKPPLPIIQSVLQAFVLLLLDRDITQEKSQKMLSTVGRIRKKSADDGILEGAVASALQVARSLSHKPILQSHIRRWVRHGNTGALSNILDSTPEGVSPPSLRSALAKEAAVGWDTNNRDADDRDSACVLLLGMCEFVGAANQLRQQYTMLQ